MSDPQTMLPQEAWTLIFTCLSNAQDILSCSQTCTLFQRCLSATRTTWAFPAVFPLLFEYLPKPDILRCRLASKSWRTAVDNFLQSDEFAPTLVNHLRNVDDVFGNLFRTRIPKHQPENVIIERLDLEMQNWQIDENMDNLNEENLDDFLPEEADDLEPVALDIYQNQLEEFISKFGGSSENNPFPSRAVVLLITDTDIEYALEFLNLFGIHIWSLGIIVQLSLRAGRVIQLIWKLLNRVPNLKHLYLHDDSRRVVLENNLNAFLQTITTPELKLLKWIELRMTIINIYDIIVNAFGGGSVTIFGFPAGIRLGDISNGWKQLDLERQAVVPGWQWEMRMMSFKHVHLPLQTINLRYSKCDGLEPIFDSLSKYGPTLRRLNLTFTQLKDNEFIVMKRQVDAIYASFLSQMKCLVSFNMVVQCDNSTVEFRQFVDEILDADWIEKYLEMGGLISGFRRNGFASISAGFNTTAGGTCSLKRKYFGDGKDYRSMEVVKKKLNWLNGVRKQRLFTYFN